MNPKELIFSLIAAGDLGKAFEKCLEEPSLDSEMRAGIVTLSAHFHHLEREVMLGVLSAKDTSTDRNQITKGLTFLLKDWNPGGEQSVVDKELERLEFDKEMNFGVSHLFNADRTRAKRTFKSIFDDKKGLEKFQFYLLCACPEEKPDSFAKRVLYEIIETECNNLKDHIKYKDQEGDDFLMTESLPCGDDMKESADKFRSFFARRFSFTDTQTFDAYLDSGIPSLEYKYVAFIFEVSEQKWKDDLDSDEPEMTKYLDWLITTFNAAKTQKVTFLFFVAIRSDNVWQDEQKHTPIQKKVLGELVKLDEAYENCILIRSFPPVDLEDAEEWLRDHGTRKADNETELLNAHIQTLKPDRQKFAQDEQKIHMKDLEILQRKVYQRAKS